jgi:hypothetical protein
MGTNRSIRCLVRGPMAEVVRAILLVFVFSIAAVVGKADAPTPSGEFFMGPGKPAMKQGRQSMERLKLLLTPYPGKEAGQTQNAGLPTPLSIEPAGQNSIQTRAGRGRTFQAWQHMKRQNFGWERRSAPGRFLFSDLQSHSIIPTTWT